MTRSTVFTTNRSQAVRLPKPVAFPVTVHQVEITKIGNARVITPVGQRWDAFFAAPGATPDFMADRAQPEPQRRKGL